VLLFGKDTETDFIVVAEIGMNHEGSFDWVKDILPSIKESGVDAVKFQLFTPDLFISPLNKKRFEQISKFALSPSQFEKIYKLCTSLELSVFATAVSHDWVPYIASKCGVIKIASGDFVFSPTIDCALRSEASIIISTGASSREEVIQFVEKAKQIRKGHFYHESIAILHCISAYPPKLEQANLRAIPDLKSLSGLTVGFSSHFMEDAPIYAALALGARIFEIHVTDDRGRMSFRDHSLSRTPSELKILISTLQKLNNSLNQKVKTIQPDEQEIQLSLRKGPIYKRSLQVGATLQASDISYARPANSDVSRIEEVVGSKLQQNVERYESIQLGHFSSND